MKPADPLSSEERKFAAMLARVAPHGVPSPEIDAQILSASHDAVAGGRGRTTPKPPRWPVALGLAASMVLAVGLAWQLRTSPPAADAGMFPVQEQLAAEAPQEPGAPADMVQAPPPPGMVAAPPAAGKAEAGPAAAPPPARALQPPRVRAPAVADTMEPEVVAMPAPMPSPPPAAPPASPAPRVAAPAASSRDSLSRTSPPATAAQRQEAARQAGDDRAAEIAATAEASASRRELRVAPTSERIPDSISTTEGGATRARRTDLQVPVAADARLQVNDWLERVRTRYGLGDEEAARRSLMLFVQDHPTETVPGDLEPLLDE